MDADLVLTFLVMMQVSWLPVGMTWGFCCWSGVCGLLEAGIVVFYRVGPRV